jgi:hypothetical protein
MDPDEQERESIRFYRTVNTLGLAMLVALVAIIYTVAPQTPMAGRSTYNIATGAVRSKVEEWAGVERRFGPYEIPSSADMVKIHYDLFPNMEPMVRACIGGHGCVRACVRACLWGRLVGG